MGKYSKNLCRIAIYAFYILIITSCSPVPELDFFAEGVTITIHDHTALVTGMYYFENLTSDRLRVTFYYPFPVDSHHHFPDTIWFFADYEIDTTGIIFTKVFKPHCIDSFTITYQQRFAEHIFRYITTTTARWKRPIKQASFTIITPEKAYTEINYEIQTDVIIDNNRYRTVLFENFCPEEDLIITCISSP
jgi:hypothetical protein